MILPGATQQIYIYFESENEGPTTWPTGRLRRTVGGRYRRSATANVFVLLNGSA